MRRDTIFYKLFQQCPSLLFNLLTNPPENASEYKFDSVVVKETSLGASQICKKTTGYKPGANITKPTYVGSKIS